MPHDPDTDAAWLREAIELARAGAAAGLGGPFGALVVIDGRIVGRGQNRVPSALDPTAHAEIGAIREACHALGRFHLRGATLYTSCEPCPMCLAAAYWAHVDRIVYAGLREDAAAAGFDDALIYRELALPIDARQMPMTPMLRAEAEIAFQEWIHNPNRTPY